MPISRIKLYHYPLSRSARVKFLLHELLDEDFDVQKVDVFKAEHFAPEFLTKNPNHALPVLDITYDDGTVRHMFESTAMLIFLADAYPEKGLAPTVDDLPARADYLQMMLFGGSWMDMMLWQMRLHFSILPDSEKIEAVGNFNRDKFQNEVEPQLTARLENHDYICGDTFSAADCLMAQNINWARAYRLCGGPVFKDYLKRLKSRKAFQQAFADAREFER